MASQHNHLAFLGWALAFAAVLLLVAGVAGGWWGAGWALWEDARFSFIAGELIYAHGPNNARTFSMGEAASPVKPEWNWTLSWHYSGKELIVRCALFVPALLLGALSVWLIRRHAKASRRHRVVDRTKHLKRTRWTLSAMLAFLVLIATWSMCFRLDYFGRHATFAAIDGRLTASWRHIPTRPGRGWSGEFIDTPRLFQSAWWNPSRAVLLCLHAETEGTDSVTVSLWFLATLTAIPTGLLWYKRFRRYPAHQCHACRYSLVGLPPGMSCPECGTERAIQAR